jgi:hypothetical protein
MAWQTTTPEWHRMANHRTRMAWHGFGYQTPCQNLDKARVGAGRKRRGDDTRVVELASGLPFIPQDDFLLQRKADAVSELPPSMAQQLSPVLLAVARALASKGQVARLRLLVAFAGNVPHRISQATFKELNQLHNSVMALS